MSPLTTLLSIIPQILENAIKTRNLYKFIPTGMEEVKAVFICRQHNLACKETPRIPQKKPIRTKNTSEVIN